MAFGGDVIQGQVSTGNIFSSQEALATGGTTQQSAALKLDLPVPALMNLQMVEMNHPSGQRLALLIL